MTSKADPMSILTLMGIISQLQTKQEQEINFPKYRYPKHNRSRIFHRGDKIVSKVDLPRRRIGTLTGNARTKKRI